MERAIKNAFIKMKRQEGVKFAAKAIGCGADPFEILKICRERMEEVFQRLWYHRFPAGHRDGLPAQWSSIQLIGSYLLTPHMKLRQNGTVS